MFFFKQEEVCKKTLIRKTIFAEANLKYLVDKSELDTASHIFIALNVKHFVSFQFPPKMYTYFRTVLSDLDMIVSKKGRDFYKGLVTLMWIANIRKSCYLG